MVDNERASRRTQVERREESDRKMLNAAAHLIATQGIGRTTLAEIGILAGYSTGLPTARYRNKLRLVEALLDDIEQWVEAEVADATRGLSGLAALRARLRVHISAAVRHPASAAALQTMITEARLAVPALRPRLAKLTRHWQEGLQSDLEGACRAGEIDGKIDCKNYAELMMGAVHGIGAARASEALEPLVDLLPKVFLGAPPRASIR
jgi:AcrR family transcriptional regulator